MAARGFVENPKEQPTTLVQPVPVTKASYPISFFSGDILPAATANFN